MRTLIFICCGWLCFSCLTTMAQLADSVIRLPYPSQPGGTVRYSTQTCGTDLLLQTLRKSTQYTKAEEKMNIDISQAIRLMNNDTIVLPVVFHILADNPFSISDAVIKNGLADLNDAFAKRGSWASSNGVDTKIRFCLAQQAPEGGNTTGITRVATHWGNHVSPLIEDAKMKASAQWDPSRYINIWFVRSIDLESIADFECGVWTRLGTGGYATLPPGGGPTDGIVTTGFGLLLAHEMGHYLGLYHTFEGFCFNNNCLLNGDRVCDTQPDGSYRASASCNSPENSCNTDTLSNYSNGNFLTDVPDPIDNIMDYSNGACQVTITQGQAERMMSAITTQRPGLLQPKCDLPCVDNVFAGFSRNIALPQTGDEVSFTNTSIGTTSYQWLLDGVEIGTSENIKYVFTNAGRFKVTLKATKSATCFSTHSEYVIVNCGVSARFYTNKHRIASRDILFRDSIVFTNNSKGATDYKWLVSNNKGMAEQLITTQKDMTFMFVESANYTIRLIASNNGCIDTTLPYTVNVAEAAMDAAIYTSAINCNNQTRIKVDFFICNNGYDTIPAGTPVSFYDADPRVAGAKKVGTTFFTPARILGYCCSWLFTHIVDVGVAGLNQLYIVVNDTGTSVPLQFPNTGMIEASYTNNINVIRDFQFRVIATPATAIMEPGDTLKLRAVGTPSAAAQYSWTSNSNLSCTNCSSPNYIADTNRTTTKRVIATSQFGCFDTAFITITVPPYNDFRIRLDSAECTGTDSTQVNFTLYNDFKRGVLPKGLTVRFYNGDPASAGAQWLPPAFILPDTIPAKAFDFSMRIKAMPNGILYALVNDSMGNPPVVLPNTWLEEKSYTNNSSTVNYTAFVVTTTPLAGLIEPGDTIALTATATPGIVKSYTWSPAYNLSCTVCQNTNMLADTSTRKRVIAENNYGCKDTAFLDVVIPPSDDFTISIDEAECAANDSIHVGFTINNSFRRGVLPKGLTIRFYDKDPRQSGAVELSPPFILQGTYTIRAQSFISRIKNSSSGKLFAVINDSGITQPLVLPNSKRLEKEYGNNIAVENYAPEILTISPQDTTVMRGTGFNPIILNTLDNPGSTRWQNGAGYSLSCNQCMSPLVTVKQATQVPVTSINQYGCILNGMMRVQILPPDFTLNILKTECINNTTTRVEFSLCMNNGYDTVWKDIPVTFYEGDPAQGNTKILKTVFVTPTFSVGNCATYVHNISTPATNALYAIVNDKGDAATPGVDVAFAEINTANNFVQATAFKRFAVTIIPNDTTIARAGSVYLFTVAEGGTLQSAQWQPSPFLACTNCPNPLVTPTYTDRYIVTCQNENQCTDTAWATVRTITNGDIYIPTAFTPDGDRLNDIFYIMGSARVKTLKDFMVYNRYGEKVFEVHNVPPNDPVFGWKGLIKDKEATGGAYVYQVQAEFIDGKTESFKGTIVLIR